jgi:hypothetical protein
MHIFTLARRAGDGASTSSDWLDEDGALLCPCLERGRDLAEHPRIPSGRYPLLLRQEGGLDARYRARFGAFHKGIVQIAGVPGRAFIEFHIANTIEELLGCIAPATQMIAPDKSCDGHWQAFASEAAYRRAYPILVRAIQDGGAQLNVEDHDT